MERTRERLGAELRRLRERAESVSILTKVMGIVVALVLALALGIVLQLRTAWRETLVRELDGRAVSIAQGLAARSADPLLARDVYTLQQLMLEAVRLYPGVRYAFIVQGSDDVVAHSFAGGFPPQLLSANRLAPGARYHLARFRTEEGVIDDVAVPLLGGRAGLVRIGMSEAGVEESLAQLTLRVGSLA
ncbi:MAG: hypothetical protein K6T35_13690, partial [Meiothermus silvanus]|nr:hypothetical protein [Allomeiothermus silvanus]